MVQIPIGLEDQWTITFLLFLGIAFVLLVGSLIVHSKWENFLHRRFLKKHYAWRRKR